MSSPIPIRNKNNKVVASPSLGRSLGTSAGMIGSPQIGSWHRHMHSSPAIGSPLLRRYDSDDDDEDDDDRHHRKVSTPPPYLGATGTEEETVASNSSTKIPRSPSSSSQRQDERGNDKLEGYLWGQIGNVVKMAVWWTVFGALVFALFDGDSLAIGAMRVSFNTAMLLFSPIAGAIADKASVRTVLMNTTVIRGMVYVVLIPGSWVLLESDWLSWSTDSSLREAFLVFFLTLVFIDGISVAFANIIDIDAGGTDLVAAQCNASVDDSVRNRFNSLHEGCFNGAMIVFSPLIALISYLATEHWHHKDRVSMLFALSGLFLITTAYSLYHYNRSLPKMSKRDNIFPTTNEMKEIVSSIVEGGKIAWTVKPVRWRLIFLALETSLEDAFVSLLIVEFALDDYYNNSKYATGNLLANCIIAVGKIGGAIASTLMHRYWKAPEDDTLSSTKKAFRPLFALVFLGAISTMFVPLGSYFNEHHPNSYFGLFLVFVGSFFFFLCSTGPKIGFATLLQGLVVETGSPGRVFGCVASFITIVDSLVLMSLSILFAVVHVRTGLWISCGLIALHGIVEYTLGPYLILDAATTEQERQKLVNGDGVAKTVDYSRLNDDDDNDDGQV